MRLRLKIVHSRSPFNIAESPYANSNASVLVSSHIITADGLAVDWIHDLVYWTDTGKNTIEVADVRDGSRRMVLVDEGLDEPRAIVVNVLDSFIIWSDWGDKPKIERALQDGSQRRTLVADNIIWPNGLAIDYVTKRIYWLDAKLFSLNSINYDGTDRRLILRSEEHIKHPFALDVFEDFVYWSDWELESVMRANKFGADNSSVELVIGGVFSVMDVRVVHPFVQPSSPNRCQHAHCSHLCLPTGTSSFRCACPAHMKLQPDSRTCVGAPPTPTTRVVDDLSTAHAHDHSAVTSTESSRDAHHAHFPSDHHKKATAADSDDGHHTVLIVVAVLSTLSVLVAICFLVVYRNYQR